MKILYIGTFDGGWVSDHYRRKAFEEIFGKDKVQIYDFRPRIKSIGQLNMNNELLKVIINGHFDIVFINNGIGIIPDVLKKCKAACPNTLMLYWYGDQRGRALKGIAESARECDYLMLNNGDKNQWKEYKRLGIKKIIEHHTATCSDAFKPCKGDFKYDISFFGSNYGERFPESKKRLDLIKRIDHKFNLIVFGRNWPTYLKRGGMVYGRDFSQAASRAKLTLGINAYSNIYNYTSNRLWNCMACGIPHITFYYTGIENYFENWKDIVWFGDIEEAIKIIKLLLQDSSLRNKIGKNGREKILNNHTYRHRALEIKKLYENWSSQRGVL